MKIYILLELQLWSQLQISEAVFLVLHNKIHNNYVQQLFIYFIAIGMNILMQHLNLIDTQQAFHAHDKHGSAAKPVQ